jgi:hypothetical protein
MGLNQTPAVVYFRHGSTGMVSAILSLIAFLTLVVWRFVFAGPHRRLLVRAIAPRQKRHSDLLAEGFHILELRGATVIVDRPLENGADERARLDRQDPAKRYLQRIAALTGATRMDDAYVLYVGKMQFHVRHRYVKRLRDTTDPDCALEETCFYPVHKGMPKAEEIATALLLLTSNPGLFDKWAAQSGAFRADGQTFRPAH